ncbi:MAG TPA: hypothetical protein PK826_15545, partial [Anaerolineae bacterium]|nr:hypothetical protein [Anaerolineae bacterium]
MTRPNRSRPGAPPAGRARQDAARTAVTDRKAVSAASPPDRSRFSRRLVWTALAAILPVCALIAWRT